MVGRFCNRRGFDPPTTRRGRCGRRVGSDPIRSPTFAEVCTDDGGVLEADTRLQARGDGRFGVVVNRNWFVFAGPNGGYVAALLLRAALEGADASFAPRTLTVHYLGPLQAGPADIEVETVGGRRTVRVVHVRVGQGGQVCAMATVALAARREPLAVFDHLVRPQVPVPERCPELFLGGGDFPIRQRWRCRWALGPRPGSAEPASPGPVEVGGWVGQLVSGQVRDEHRTGGVPGRRRRAVERGRGAACPVPPARSGRARERSRSSRGMT